MTEKLFDIISPELDGVGEEIDRDFRLLTECLYSWIDCHNYQSGKWGREDLIKQLKKTFTSMNRDFNDRCLFLTFRFTLKGYVWWLMEKRKNKSIISFNEGSQRYSPDEVIDILGGEFNYW